MINCNNRISGICLPNVSIKLLSYADDTVIITDGTEISINEALATLKMFSHASGLNLNLEKSFVFLLGSLHRNPPGSIRNSRITVLLLVMVLLLT